MCIVRGVVLRTPKRRRAVRIISTGFSKIPPVPASSRRREPVRASRPRRHAVTPSRRHVVRPLLLLVARGARARPAGRRPRGAHLGRAVRAAARARAPAAAALLQLPQQAAGVPGAQGPGRQGEVQGHVLGAQRRQLRVPGTVAVPVGAAVSVLMTRRRAPVVVVSFKFSHEHMTVTDKRRDDCNGDVRVIVMRAEKPKTARLRNFQSILFTGIR